MFMLNSIRSRSVREWTDKLVPLVSLRRRMPFVFSFVGRWQCGRHRARSRLRRLEAYAAAGLLMRALSAEGNTAEALRVYEHLRVLLRDELGIGPSASTQAAYAALLG